MPHIAAPQSLGAILCSQRLVEATLAQLSTVQGLRSSQSTGALRVQRNTRVSQLQVPRQASWLSRWQGVSPASPSAAPYP